MPVDAPTPEELRAALRPQRTDPKAFEQGVRERIEAAEEGATERVRTVSPLVRAAATFLPLPLLGGKALLTSAKSGSMGGGTKALGYLALPAVSIFLVLGAFVFSALRIRKTATSDADREEDVREAMKAWWRKHWWVALPFYVGVIAALIWASSTVIFVLLLVSFVALAVFLAALSRAGLATRGAIARVSSMGLLYLAMPMIFGVANRSSDSFVDGRLHGSVLGLGAILLVWVGGPWAAHNKSRAARWGMALGLLPMTLMGLIPVLRPATPDGLQEYVESFDEAPFHSASWHEWEVPATWLRDRGRDVDWSAPRALLRKEELVGEQNPYVLGTAMRVGLLEPSDLAKLRELAKERDDLIGPRRADLSIFLDQEDWSIRALAALGTLSDADRDLLAGRLQATWERLREEPNFRLKGALRITRVREVIQRPGDVQAQRADVHTWLREASQTKRTSYLRNGGFRAYKGGYTNDDATWAAVCLMERYGVPEGIDLRVVRSSASPRSRIFRSPDWVAAATRWKIDTLPEWRQPSFFDYLAHERMLVACILLVLLALYATLRAPRTPQTENA